jgi:polar amino acid transport system substrate-binding protein
VLPYARCKDYVLRGKVAAGFSMSWLDEFKGKVLFSIEPLFICHDDFFFKNGSPLLHHRAGDLPPGTVTGVVIGYEYPPAIYALRDKGVIRFEESESEEMNLKKLALGRLDSALINYNETKPAELRLASAGVLGQVTRGARGGILKGYIGFSLQHPQGPWAKRKFDQGHQLIAANGTLAKITRLWVAKAQQKTAALSDKSHGAQ